MDVGDWIAVAVAVIGAAAAFFGARAGARAQRESSHEATTQQERQGRRDEWGRRFTAALDLLGQPTEPQRRLGAALVSFLLDSDLATEDDRGIGKTALRAVVGEMAFESEPVAPDVTFEFRRRLRRGRAGGRMSGRVVKVRSDQVAAARALVKLSGGPEHVEPYIRKIAEARPAVRPAPPAAAPAS